MISRFINFEGIHGSGKSTTAWILHKSLSNNMINSKVYLEADIDKPYENPCDFQFMSAISEKDFNALARKFPGLREKVSVQKIDEYRIVYNPFFNDIDLINKLSKYQVYGGRFSFCEFKLLMKERFTYFVNKALKDIRVYVFESVLFQHITNELYRFNNINKIEIAEFINELADILKPLNPILFYLYTKDIKTLIDRIASERLSDNYNLYPDWIDYMIEYVKASRYGVDNNVSNRSDFIEYLRRRSQIENYVYDNLTINKHRISVQDIDTSELNNYVFSLFANSIS